MAAPHDLPLTGLKPAAPRKLAATADKPVAPKKPAVRRPAVMSAQQQAQQIVAQELNPLVNQQRTFSNQQNTAIANFTKMLLDAVKGTPAQIGAGYDKAIGTQTSIANAAADALRNANPNQQNQAILNAVGAPDAQKSQIASSLADTFNGGAAVGQYRNLLNTNDLQAGKLASMNIASTLPAVEGLRGHQALQNALFKQSSDMAQITGQRPKLFQDALSSIYDQQAKQQQLNYEAKALGYPDPSLSSKLGYEVTKSGNPVLTNGKPQLLPGFSVDKNGQIVKVSSGGVTKSAAAKISASVSSHAGRGIALDSQGRPVLVNGKTIPWSATSGSGAVSKTGGIKPATQSQVQSFLKNLVTFKSVNTSDGNGTSTTTKDPSGHTMPFLQAYKRLRNMGLDDVTARSNLSSIYKRGQDGRSWLTNEEQAVLRQAQAKTPGPRLQLTRASKVKINGQTAAFISPLQSQWLRAAGMLPAGEWGKRGGVDVYWIAPVN